MPKSKSRRKPKRPPWPNARKPRVQSDVEPPRRRPRVSLDEAIATFAAEMRWQAETLGERGVSISAADRLGHSSGSDLPHPGAK